MANAQPETIRSRVEPRLSLPAGEEAVMLRALARLGIQVEPAADDMDPRRRLRILCDRIAMASLDRSKQLTKNFLADTSTTAKRS